MIYNRLSKSEEYLSGYGDVRLAAERADGSVVNRSAAVRASALKKFAAYSAEPSSDRVLNSPVRTQKTSAVHNIARVGRTKRIRAEAGFSPARIRQRRCRSCSRSRAFLLWNLYLELSEYLSDNLVVQLRPVPLLEHGKRRLLAAYFGCKHALRKPRAAPRLLRFSADLWTEIYHAYYYGLFYSESQRLIINTYQQIYKLLDDLLIIMFISSYLC